MNPILFLVLGALAVGLVVVLGSAAWFTRLTVFPPRQRLRRSPSDVGIRFEDVTFQARDGVRLSGWVLHPRSVSERSAPAVVMVHGWPWNRHGTAGRQLHDLPKAQPVDLLPLAATLCEAGYVVLMFDLRNHGVSEASRPMSMGWMESQDVAAAAELLAARSDVDASRIGSIGFSLGGNAVLYALLVSERLKAAIAVQPMTANVFAAGFGRDLLGPLWPLVDPLSRFFYRVGGGFQFEFIDPVLIAPGIAVPVLYVQGTGDRWGSVVNVAAMAAASPGAVPPLFPETADRYGGYHWVLDHAPVVVDFFDRQLASGLTGPRLRPVSTRAVS
jgi:dienelactone hydrolase